MTEPTRYLVTARVTFPVDHDGELSELVARAEIQTRLELWDGTLQEIDEIEVDS